MSDTRDISLDQLLLDEQNPRLPTTIGRQQTTMITYIARTTSIAEIMTAIAENGFFPGEPLIVIPGDGNKFIVVEGNRRLTALKLLQQPELYAKSRKIRDIADEAEHRPTSIPCVVFPDRDDVINYLGYRHITGVKQWEPLAKARYIANYFQHHTDDGAKPYPRYVEVARGIGSQAPYIKRQLDGLAIYEAAERADFYAIPGLDEENISFSLVSTAVGYDSVLDFVASCGDPFVDTDCLRKKNVEHLIRWMFEQDSEGETRLGDSRNIQKLAVILADPEATKRLIEGESLDRAYGRTKGLSDDFASVLAAAEMQVTKAVGMIALVELDNSHITRIGNIFKQAKSLRSLADDN